ncbi:MAG: hypothetical protein Q7T72_09450 [Bacteroidales bacterium]|nr:hypothetical protein [Bacteroidales bacterium]
MLNKLKFDKLLNGNLQVKQLRKVQLEDLLGREPIPLDLLRIEQGLNGKMILVTGAAGSIGSEIVPGYTSKYAWRPKSEDRSPKFEN